MTAILLLFMFATTLTYAASAMNAARGKRQYEELRIRETLRHLSVECPEQDRH